MLSLPTVICLLGHQKPHVLKTRKPGRGTTGNPCFVRTSRELDAQPSLVRASRGSDATVHVRERQQLSQTLRVRPAPKGMGEEAPWKEGEGDPRQSGTRACAGRRGGCWSSSGHGDIVRTARGETAGRREPGDRGERAPLEHRRGKGSEGGQDGKHAARWALSWALSPAPEHTAGRRTSTASTVVRQACWFGFCLSCG